MEEHSDDLGRSAHAFDRFYLRAARKVGLKIVFELCNCQILLVHAG